MESEHEHDIKTDARRTTEVSVARFVGQECRWVQDELAVEEPLQIRLAGEDVVVTMRTPGNDDELAAGFLFTEGIIAGKHHIEEISYCLDDEVSARNVINVTPTERGLLEPGRWGRNFYATSSCGICGKTSIDQIIAQAEPRKHNAKVRISTLYALDQKVRDAQAVFAQTGGLHAAALFDLDGTMSVLREDVGRHNAVDKVIGHALLKNMLPLEKHILFVSSRASFEIVQKALMAGIGIMAVVSAPSSLAVELARHGGMTLVGFLRGERMNIYAGTGRVE